MTLVIICDLEGVLTDNAHRLHLFKAGQWDEYESECVNDAPFTQTIKMVRTILELNESSILVVVTGRYPKWEQLTNQWLMDNRVYPDWVVYRDKFDIPKTKEPLLKEQMLAEIKNNYGEEYTFLALDDKDDCVEMYRNAGIECWQVRAGVLG